MVPQRVRFDGSCWICRSCLQSRVLDSATDGEMVEVLILAVPEAKDLMHRVVEITADPGTSDSSGFRFQIEHLSDHVGLPKQAWIEPRAVPIQWFLIRSNHPQTKTPIAGDRLRTGHLLGGVPCVRFDEAIQLEFVWTTTGAHLRAGLSECRFKRGLLRAVTNEEVESGGKIIHAVNKKWPGEDAAARGGC